MGFRRQCQRRKNEKKKIKSEQELELKRKQLEIDEKKAKPSWTATPRFYGRDAKYASKHYETYEGISTSNE